MNEILFLLSRRAQIIFKESKPKEQLLKWTITFFGALDMDRPAVDRDMMDQGQSSVD